MEKITTDISTFENLRKGDYVYVAGTNVNVAVTGTSREARRVRRTSSTS